MWKYILAWVPMVAIAIGNAAFREGVLAEHMSELRAHQSSTGTAILLLGAYIWILTRAWALESSRQALVIGFAWLGLTVAFEFLFGHFIVGHPWSRLLNDYNLFAGRVWAILLAWVTLAPYVLYRFQR